LKVLIRARSLTSPTLSDPIHLQPTAPLAERVLLPGDPGRALLLCQELLEKPIMFNHNRGLWGYSGTASDGGALTIQSTGMGGPSAAIVVSELAGAGKVVSADPGLTATLRAANHGSLRSGSVISTDLFYDERNGQELRWREAGALAVEMETATLYALAQRRGLEAASLLIVSDLLLPRRVRIEAEQLRSAERRLGKLAMRGLTQSAASPRAL
jgi:purine-nucleoside phosphorylase